MSIDDMEFQALEAEYDRAALDRDTTKAALAIAELENDRLQRIVDDHELLAKLINKGQELRAEALRKVVEYAAYHGMPEEVQRRAREALRRWPPMRRAMTDEAHTEPVSRVVTCVKCGHLARIVDDTPALLATAREERDRAHVRVHEREDELAREYARAERAEKRIEDIMADWSRDISRAERAETERDETRDAMGRYAKRLAHTEAALERVRAEARDTTKTPGVRIANILRAERAALASLPPSEAEAKNG